VSPEHHITNKEIFDNLFEYDTNSIEHVVTLDESSSQIYFLNAWKSDYYSLLRSLVRKNKISKSIKHTVDLYKTNFNIDENTLAVHIRLTDMNVKHINDYGYRDFNDFCAHIDKMIAKYPNINSIYVCSDNDESINKLIAKYTTYKIHYITDTHRVEKEDSDNYASFLKDFNNIEHIEIKLFTELLLAAQCSYFICRVSDFANFAILYSDTFKEIDYLN